MLDCSIEQFIFTRVLEGVVFSDGLEATSCLLSLKKGILFFKET